MIVETIRELAAAEKKVAWLEQRISKEMKQDLASLPSRYGFKTVGDLARAIFQATLTKKRRRGKKKSSLKRPRKKQIVISAQIRTEIRKMLQSEKAGIAIAQGLGLSLQKIQKLRKSTGLVKNKKKYS
ncbi:MAG TPA: hypothetical protein VNV15_06255 [Opitutaceae bacterium]|jgi:hypothetical protein|nr:hypothetical protein [Opitutaceae bacterium]